jgi:hypothetical protein
MDEEDSELASAALITRTGIALVQEGERILPAADSEAEAEYLADGRYTVHYHFPVEIEIRGRAPDVDSDAAILQSHRLFALSLDGQ